MLLRQMGMAGFLLPKKQAASWTIIIQLQQYPCLFDQFRYSGFAFAVLL